MLRSKTADRIVCIAAVFMLAATVCLWGIVEPVQGDGSHEIGYESLLFDQSRVHNIEITTDHWDEIISNAAAEEYQECSIVIDGENLGQVGIRAKGNTSLSSVATLDSERYSFKVEFNHYMKGKSYHGLDKLSLNNLIQDATMMKDYLAYTLMGKMGVPSSLCSYVQITVNGEPWGLYLAVEGVEDAFLERNGMTSGELYKPDSMSFGGGRGNGGDFDIEKFRETEDETDSSAAENPEGETAETGGTVTLESKEPSGTGQDGTNSFAFPGNPFGGGSFSPPEGMPDMPGGMPDMSGNMPQMPGGFSFPGSTEGTETLSGTGSSAPEMPGGGFGGFNFGMGSDDVRLIYTDDDPDSYSNIFNNAKTTISSRDKTRLISSLKKLNKGEDLDSVVNKDEVITYLAVHNFLCNDDSYTGMMVHNYYLYEEKGKLTILPWDYNLAFGGFSAAQDATSTVNSAIDSPVTSGTTDSRPLIAWIFNDEEALEQYHETYSRFISEWIESGWLEEEITRVQEMITPYLENDSSAFFSMEEFEKAVSTLKTFCARRGESIRGQLDGTIPSTTQGQREDSSALIDASEISTADMGSMNNGNNPGGGGGPTMPGGGGFTVPGGGFDPSSFSGGSFTMPGSGDGNGFDPSSFGSGNFAMPGSGSSGGGSFTPPDGTASAASEGAPAAGSTESGVSAAEGTEAGETAAPAEQPAGTGTFAASGPPQEGGDRGGMPGGFPGMDGFQAGTDHTQAWIWTGVCAALLLAAVLIVRKTRSHNS